jgi:hypothetical protein
MECHDGVPPGGNPGQVTWLNLHRPNFSDIGYEMAQQILDAVAQRRRR